MIIAYYYVTLDSGLWILDEKNQFLYVCPASSIQ